jgi:DNA polymerase-3 subunit epsilon
MPSSLRELAGGAERFVVVDTETTGVYPSDRIVEISIVTVDLEGQVIDVYDTLINPLRDVSATHIHGVTGAMVLDAPTFAEAAGDIAIRLHGACFVAHNLPFDRRMLVNEYARLGADLLIPLGIDTLAESGSRLSAACAEYDIDLTGAHRSVNDAMATANLFLALTRSRWEVTGGGPLLAPSEYPRAGKVRRREDMGRVTLPETPLITFLASRLPFAGAQPSIIEYLELVSRALVDLHIDREERRILTEFAADLGLNELHVRQAHRRFLNELVDAAVADDVVTDEEYDMLVRVAAALEIDQKELESRVHKLRTSDSAVVLAEGMRVVFSGDHDRYSREDLEDMAHGLGLATSRSVSKLTSFVCAADPDSNSGKAAKARTYGVPIVAMAEFVNARLGSVLAGSGGGQASLKVITCRDCLVTWTVPATQTASALQRCSDCAGLLKPAVSTKPARPAIEAKIVDVWAPPTIEWLSCRSCNSNWHRQVTRGRKPHYCPACTGATEFAAPTVSE